MKQRIKDLIMLVLCIFTTSIEDLRLLIPMFIVTSIFAYYYFRTSFDWGRKQ